MEKLPRVKTIPLPKLSVETSVAGSMRHKLIKVSVAIFVLCLSFIISSSNVSAGANFTEFPLPDPAHGPTATYRSPSGELWFSTITPVGDGPSPTT